MTVDPKKLPLLVRLVAEVCNAQGRVHGVTRDRIENAECEILQTILRRLERRSISEEKLAHYVRKSAKWEAQRYYRGKRQIKTVQCHEELNPLDMAQDRREGGGDPTVEVVKKEESERIQRAIKQLPLQQADIVRTFAEADGTNRPVAQLRSRWKRNRKWVYYQRNLANKSLRESETELRSKTMQIELDFPVRGEGLPTDHYYLLYSCLTYVVSAFHSLDLPLRFAPITGEKGGKGEIRLNNRSRLRLRLAAEEIGAVLPLASRTLKVGDHSVHLGIPTVGRSGPRRCWPPRWSHTSTPSIRIAFLM